MRREPSRDLVPPVRLRRLQRLRRRSDVRGLARVLRSRGVEGWLVGGIVRDALLGIPDAEVDAAIAGDAEAVARELEASGAGRAIFLSRDRPGPKVYRVAGRRPIDIAELEGGAIETDLRRRDFTVNAVAISLADGTLLDPHGGLRDLERRRLHPVRASNLLDDPLRALRAARLLATRGLRPDRATLEAARVAAPGLASVAAERVGAELSRILGSPKAGEAIAWTERAGLLEGAMGIDLDPIGRRRVASALRTLDDPATTSRPDAEDRRRRLRTAATAWRLGLDGPATRKWLSGRRWPRREVDDAATLVDLVRSPPRSGSGPDAWRWRIAAGPLAGDAVHILARRPGRKPTKLASLRKLARAPIRRVAVTGEDIMQWLGIPAGPSVGGWLAELAIAAASGAVKSRREARNWLTGQVRDRPSAAIIAAH